MYLITTKKLNEVVFLGIGNVFLQNLAVFYLFDWDWVDSVGDGISIS